MRIAFFSTESYDKESFDVANTEFGYEIEYFESRLNGRTAAKARGFDAVCAFVNDKLDAKVLAKLASYGVKIVAMRCAGFDNVDVGAAQELGIKIVRVPAYSPYAVAEHGAALLLALTRKLPQACARTKAMNFELGGLTGRDLHGLTAGILGTGKIGRIMAGILRGFGMNIIAYDAFPDKDWAKENGVKYVELEDLYRECDVLSLHCPLMPETRHIVGHAAIQMMKNDAVIINVARGALIDSRALLYALRKGQIGGAAIDVYEGEGEYFFNDWSTKVVEDDVLARLMSLPNVIITGHQAFLTKNALKNIADATLGSLRAFEEGADLVNEVKA